MVHVRSRQVCATNSSQHSCAGVRRGERAGCWSSTGRWRGADPSAGVALGLPALKCGWGQPSSACVSCVCPPSTPLLVNMGYSHPELHSWWLGIVQIQDVALLSTCVHTGTVSC